jgi:hypothetical protein
VHGGLGGEGTGKSDEIDLPFEINQGEISDEKSPAFG